MSINYNQFMKQAIKEAWISLQEGNNGFGAVIEKEGRIITRNHDTENSTGDSTAHAELLAIRAASSRLGKNLAGCTLISTHEPCPMCATAIVWSGVEKLVFGYSIKKAIDQGRSRIDISCKEIFKRAKVDISVFGEVLSDECAVLYNRQVRKQVKALRNYDLKKLNRLETALTEQRIKWFKANFLTGKPDKNLLLPKAYELFIRKLGILPDDAQVVSKNENSWTIHSSNFCPTLEACKILGLDTRIVCQHTSEKPMSQLLKQLNVNLGFSRNYDKIRPNTPFCEETIYIDTKLEK